MMTYGWISKERVGKHAEVFTPAGTVFEMLLQEDISDCLKEVDKTMFDPCVGEGEFPCAELVWKIFFNHESLTEEMALRALQSIYGMDIQEESVWKCRVHLLLTLADSYRYFTGKEFTRIDEAKKIVIENIRQGDSLKQMREWVAQKHEVQQSLF